MSERGFQLGYQSRAASAPGTTAANYENWEGAGVMHTHGSGTERPSATAQLSSEELLKFQSRKSSCGPASLQNALEAIGIKRSEDELAALCKQTASGTTGIALRKALGSIEGVVNVVIDEARSDVAILRLQQSLYDGRPIICCVEGWEHWAVAVGVLGFGKRIVCVDSGDNELVVIRGVDEFVEWWRGPDGAKRPFYGVVV